MERYEIAVLYDPGLEVGFDKAEASFKKVVENNSGKVVSVDNWGKRRLAYPIRKHESALYAFYDVDLPPEFVNSLNAELNITTEIIRFLITKPDQKKRAKAEAEKSIKLKKSAARVGHNNDDESEVDDES